MITLSQISDANYHVLEKRNFSSPHQIYCYFFVSHDIYKNLALHPAPSSSVPDYVGAHVFGHSHVVSQPSCQQLFLS
jgi:hypothetical protein